MPNRNKISSKLSNNWLDTTDPEEVEQEELIQAWQYPDLEGYQGMLAYRTLLYSALKEAKDQERTTELKKNTPAKNTGASSFEFILEDYMLGLKEEERGMFCLLAQPLLQSHYYGRDIGTLDKHSEYLGVSKSGLGRALSSHRDLLDRSTDQS